MKVYEIELKLRELLLDVLGLDAIEDIPPKASLVEDLDAESLDFVETLWVIEDNFGVVLKTNEIISGQVNDADIDLFKDDKLTNAGVTALKKQFPHRAEFIKPGLTKVAIFRMITVHDLAVLIAAKLAETAVTLSGI